MSGRRHSSRVGTPAVPFDVADVTGTRHTLAQYPGRWLWLVFHRHLG